MSVNNNSDIFQEYPYNVQPQFRSPKPSSPLPCLKCPPDNSLQAIQFSCNTIAVMRGSESKSIIDLKEFFVPNIQYSEYEYLLEVSTPVSPGSDEYNYKTLSYGLVGDADGAVTFLLIYPQYIWTELDQKDWKINYRYEGVDDWTELDRILLLSHTANTPIPPIELQNRTSSPIILKILIGT